MTARDTLEYLSNIGMSPHYMKPITLYKNLQFISQCKIDYEVISNPIDILPPSVWFTIDHNECLSKIRNDVEKSRVTRQGYLITNTMGNCLNQINYQSFDQDIGVIQENEHCFCVPFSVVKDNCQEILKYIHKELRIFHETFLINKVKRSYMNSQYLDQISQFIYSKFRTFIIFEAKMQSARVPILQSCYYPNVNFIIQKIKTKEGPKFSPNEILNQIKEGGLKNTFGYLSLDRKRRFLLMKRDEPDLDFERQCFIGVWVSSYLPLKRTQKKFAKDDSIWCAIYEFYTNKELKNRIKLTEKNKAFLVYFPPSTPNKPKRAPEYYMFEPDNKIAVPKWCFMLKQETLTDWKKNLQVKFDFLNNTIMEQREYSQFSDATNNEEKQLNMQKMENIHNNMGNNNYLSGTKDAISDLYLSNSRNGLYAAGPSKSSRHSSSGEEKQKSRIEQLERELEYYKKRCLELETMNNMLLSQQQNLLAQQQQYHANTAIMQQLPPQMYFNPLNSPFSQFMQNTPSYPLTHSQVGAISPTSNPPHLQNPSQKRTFYQPEKQKAAQQKAKPQFVFPQVKQEEMTFGIKDAVQGENESEDNTNTMFLKKKSSNPSSNSNTLKKESQILKNNSSSIREIFVKPDARNISFQDSFAEYHQQDDEEEQYEEDGGDYQFEYPQNDDEEDTKRSKTPNKQNVRENKVEQKKTSKIKKYSSYKEELECGSGMKNRKARKQDQGETEIENMKSPQFRRFDSQPAVNSNQKETEQIKSSPRAKNMNAHRNLKGYQDESDDQKNIVKVEETKKQVKEKSANSSFNFEQFLSKYNISKNQFKNSPKKTQQPQQSDDEETGRTKKTNPYEESAKQNTREKKKQENILLKSPKKHEVEEKNDSEDSDEDIQLKNILNRYKN